MAKMLDGRVLAEFCEALSIGPASEIRRVVIDIEAGQIPMVHIEKYVTDRMLNVVRTLDGVEITTVGANDQRDAITPDSRLSQKVMAP